MSKIAANFSNLKLAEPITQHNLEMFPLIDPRPHPPLYFLMDEAVATAKFHLTEVSAQGSVPYLLAVNELDQPVLILDGEQLIGAKQNRIANLTILVPAQTTVKIPVSCVEQGRWHSLGAEFAPSPNLMFGSSRSRKAQRVSTSLHQMGLPDAGQAAVWCEVACMMEAHCAVSDTGAMNAAFEVHRGRLEDYVLGMKTLSGQAGALFALNGRITALDLFDSPATLAHVLPKLVRSQAIDAIEHWETHPPKTPPVAPSAFLEEIVQAEIDAYPGIGLGTMLRLRGKNLAGGALVCDDHLIHLCAFRLTGNGSSHRGGFAFLD